MEISQGYFPPQQLPLQGLQRVLCSQASLSRLDRAFSQLLPSFLTLPFIHWDLELLQNSLALGTPFFSLLGLWEVCASCARGRNFLFPKPSCCDPFSLRAAQVNSRVLAADEVQGNRSQQQDLLWQRYSQHVHGLCREPDQICRGTGRRNPR